MQTARTRVWGILLAFIMLLTMTPTTVLADDTAVVTDPATTENNNTGTGITTADALQSAITSATGPTELSLGDSISLASPLTISDAKTITLDLNGHTLNAGSYGISVTSSSTLTIKDSSTGTGKITAEHEIEVENASLILDSGTIDIDRSYGVYVSDGGSAIVNGGTITSLYAPLGGNNTTGDMNFAVHGGMLTAKMGPAIYMPGQVTLEITGGTLNGGVSLRMGQVTISGGTINATKDNDNIDDIKDYYNGQNVWLADALFVFNGTYTSENTTYGNSLNLKITGGVFNCDNGQGSAIAVYDLARVDQNSTITISGNAQLITNATNRSAYDILSVEDVGVTDSQYGITEYEGKVFSSITGGTFSSDVSDYVADDYECAEPTTAGGMYTVKPLDNKLVVSGEVSGSGDSVSVSGTLSGDFSAGGTIIEDKTDNDITGDNDEESVTSEVSVNLTTNSNTTSTTLTVTNSAATSLGAATSLTVQTDVGSVSFNDIALDTIAEANGEVSIEVQKAASAPSGTLVSYTVTAQSGTTNLLPYGEDKGTVTITVDKPTGTYDDLQAWYVTESNGSLVYVDQLTYEETADGKLAITINHLSTIVLRSGSPNDGNTAVAVIDDQGYTSLEEAIANAKDGDIITIVADEIDLGNDQGITLNKKLTIQGNGNTVIKGTGTADYASGLINFESGSEGSVLKDLTIQYTATGVQRSAVYFGYGFTGGNENNVTKIQNVNFVGADSLEDLTSQTATAITSTYITGGYIEITGCNIENFAYGMYFNAVKNLTISNNTIDGTKYNAINIAGDSSTYPCSDITIEGNTLTNISYADYEDDGTYSSGINIGENAKTVLIESNDITMLNDKKAVNIVLPEDDTKVSIIYTVNGEEHAVIVAEVSDESATYTAPADPTNISGYTFNSWNYGSYESDVTVNGNTVTITVGDNAPDDNIYTFTANLTSTGSTSSGVTRYNITIEDMENGGVTSSHSRASRGTTVTLTINPDDGYELDELIVTDANGDEIDLTRKSATKYTFEMPRSRVTVEATFAEEEVVSTLPFDDVDVDDWFHDAVEYAYENDLMNGVSDDEFDPNGTLTRGMMVTVLYRLEGEPESRADLPFEDVEPGTWYTEAVRWAVDEGIVLGTSDTTYEPDAMITREQLATMLYRYAEYKDYDTTQGGMAIREFEDYEEISDWALEGLDWAVNAELVNGVGNNTIAPLSSATRAETATLLMRFIEAFEA